MKQFIKIMVGQDKFLRMEEFEVKIPGTKEIHKGIAPLTTFAYDLKKTININHIKEFGNGVIRMIDGENHRVNLSYDEIKELIINPHF